MPKRILIIGMVNSVHLANWVERIAHLNLKIQLFPSRHYRKLHPKLDALIHAHGNIKLISILPSRYLSIYFEYALDTKPMRIFDKFSRSSRLRKVLEKNTYLKVHALEIQHAGYLLSRSIPLGFKSKNIIVTNWGSDIYYFSQFPIEVEKIRNCLSIASFYSAECRRDYALARNFGFSGIDLPIVPNSTTFPESYFRRQLMTPRARRQIILKCYGDQFGLGNLLLNVADVILSEDTKIYVYAYSVTGDLVRIASQLEQKYPKRFRFSTLKNPVSHERMISEFETSRVYMGASKSDGISTSFLEALATGAYPIQTSTSCAGEWIKDGARGSIVPTDEAKILSALKEVLHNFELLENAQMVNSKLAHSRLSFETISEVTRTFYL